MKKRTIKKAKAPKKQITLSIESTLPDNAKVEAMRQHFIQSPPAIGIQKPIISKLKTVKIADIIHSALPDYQRGYEHSRTEIIVNSIIRFDEIGSSIITIVIDKDGNIIAIHDGRHRVVARYILGMKTIKANIVRFKNRSDEIDYFNMVNVSHRPLTPKQRTLNSFQANHPLGLLIYDLGFTNEDSKWSGKIDLLGTETSETPSKVKLSVANFRKILNWVAFGLRRRMEGESDVRATRKLEKMKYEDIVQRMNDFHDWYYKFANFPHVKGDVFTKDKVIISMLEFYHCALHQKSSRVDLSAERILEASYSKFIDYNFGQLNQFDVASAPDKLIEVFNGVGKRQRVNKMERIPMS